MTSPVFGETTFLGDSDWNPTWAFDAAFFFEYRYAHEVRSVQEKKGRASPAFQPVDIFKVTEDTSWKKNAT